MEIKLYFLNGETEIVRRKFKRFTTARLFEIYQDLNLPAGTDFTFIKHDCEKVEILVIENKYLPAHIYRKVRDRNTGKEFIGVCSRDKYNSAYDIANEKFPNLISKDFYKTEED